MSDNLVNFKKSLIKFIKDSVTNVDNGFSTAFTDINEQVYWEWTTYGNRSDTFPYIYIEKEEDSTLGYGTYSSYEKRDVGGEDKLFKITKEFNVYTVAINVVSMSTGTNSLSGLAAQDQANSISRLLRRLLKSDEATLWFSDYQNTFNLPIGVQSEDLSSIQYLPDYEDTKPKHRFRFTIPFNWTDKYEKEVDIAQSAKIIKINGEDTNIIITPE